MRKQSIKQIVRSYWAKDKSALLQEIALHELSFAKTQSGKATPESVQPIPERTNARNRDACNLTNVYSASSFESLVESVKSTMPALQQVLTISEQCVVTFDQSSADLTSITAMDQLVYCIACLCLCISDLETSTSVHNRIFTTFWADI